VVQKGNKVGVWERKLMARNKVQLQKGLSEVEFQQQFGTEEQCRAAIVASRWPDGFSCPECGSRKHSVVETRDLFQCSACRRQTSPIAGTIFASTKLPLCTWFRAIYHMTQTKQGISSIELGRRLGVTQTTAWKVKHKLAQVMMERDATKYLSGRIEIDDAYIGGERTGGKRGRGAAGKTPFVAAVETTPEGKPIRIKLGRVDGFSNKSISAFAKRKLESTCIVVSDGLRCFAAVTEAGCTHEAIRTGSGPTSARNPVFKWVNTALGNIKAAITGTYRSINSKHVSRYLAEFEYRFNRRYDLAAMLPRLCWAGVRTPPMPYRLLKLAEVYA
jgi:transposase-like protein